MAAARSAGALAAILAVAVVVLILAAIGWLEITWTGPRDLETLGAAADAVVMRLQGGSADL